MDQKNCQEARKKESYQQIIELQKKLDDKQRLELEIEQIRQDLEAREKIESLEEKLKEKADGMEYLEDLTQDLITWERKSSNELEDARKVMISFLQERPLSEASIGVKRMGDLDHRPFVSAAKKKYTACEAEEKAMEFVCQVDDKLRNPDWYPFKGIMVGQERKEVIDGEDDFIKAIKNEWGTEAYDAVVTAVTEMNDYNPSGRFSVRELWNFEEGRRATLAECVKFIAKLQKEKRRMRT